MTDQEKIDLILGPQAPIGDIYFDRIQVAKGKELGESCPAVPPTDPSALNDYILHLQYYDLPQCEYAAHRRTGDPAFQSWARNAADSWWQHPSWIGSGKIRLWETEGSATPAPRHAGIGGLILRALDGRPEFWDWIVGYTRWNFEIWLKSRVNNPGLHNGVREGAFMLQYAAWIAVCLPDSYPNAAVIRAQFLADVENVAVNYFGRLQLSDGSWRWNDVDGTDPDDGGTFVGIMQAFQIGLLLRALVDVHRLTTNPTVKESVKNQILNGCRHLYSDGPYRKDEPIPYDPSKRRRGFWYLYHGGTTVNPTKFEKGGWNYPGNNITEIQEERQPIGTIVAAYGYAYLISGDPFFKTAGDELWDSAYGDTDGIHNFYGTDGKGYNQNIRAASYLPWAGAPTQPAPAPIPEPAPKPAPPTPPAPTPTPQPDPAPQPTTDSIPVVALTSPANGAKISGQLTVTANVTDGVEIDSVYLLVDDWVITPNAGSFYSFTVDTKKLPDGLHSLFVRAWNKLGKGGDSARISITVANVAAPEPVPVPEPIPPPKPEPPSPIPTPTPTPVPTPPRPSISAPVSVNIPRNGTGTIAVTLNDLTGPLDVNVEVPDGQIVVSPSTWHAGPTSTVKQFSVKVKKQSRKITFRSPCGVAVVQVNVG